MNDPELEVLMKIVAFMVVIALAVVFAQVEAHEGPNGCYPQASFEKLQTVSHYSHIWSDGTVDSYICDDVAKKEGIMGTHKKPKLLNNQILTEQECGDMTLKVWIVNCNEA